MQELFKDILDIDQVRGVIFISFAGDTIYNEFRSGSSGALGQKNWSSFATALSETLEAEIIYDRCMLYILKAETGFLIVVMDKSAPIAMVRLNCAIIQPALTGKKGTSRGLGRFFRRKNGD